LSLDDAFQNDMRIREIPSIDAERLLSLDPSAAEDSERFADLAALLETAREELPEERPVDPVFIRSLAQAALAARAEAEERSISARRRATPVRRSRLALLGKVGVATGVLVVSMAGLAIAGVDVSAPAGSVLEDLGITHPDKGNAGNAGQGSDPATPSKGKSSAAHQRVLDRRANRPAGHGKALGHERGRAIGLKGLTPPGRDGVTNGPPPHSNAGGSGHSNSGGGGGSQGAAHGQGGGGQSESHPAPAGKAKGHSDGHGPNG
jgi:hypothetical protein